MVIGNKTVSETIASALFNAGVKVLTSVPGFGVNDVFTDYNRLVRTRAPVSFHEEVAYSITHGASLVGTRSASLMKSHGFVKAGNSISDSLYAGTTAGLLTIVFSDPDGRQSDSILDIKPFLTGIGIPYEKADPRNIYPQIIELFKQSQKRCLPYALVVEAHDIIMQVAARDWPQPDLEQSAYQRDISQHVLCPFFVDHQSSVLKYKIENKDWRTIPRPSIPSIPDELPEKWKPAAASYTRLFSVFRSMRGSLVVGDTGVSTLFACEPYNCVDITTYMGGSVPLAVGAYLGGYRDVWALTGDFSFIAAGHLGLLEARQRQIPLKTLILYNGKAETTGGQPIPENTLETVLAGYKKNVRFIKNPGKRQEIESVLSEAIHSTDMRIVVADFRQNTEHL